MASESSGSWRQRRWRTELIVTVLARDMPARWLSNYMTAGVPRVGLTLESHTELYHQLEGCFLALEPIWRSAIVYLIHSFLSLSLRLHVRLWFVQTHVRREDGRQVRLWGYACRPWLRAAKKHSLSECCASQTLLQLNLDDYLLSIGSSIYHLSAPI